MFRFTCIVTVAVLSILPAAAQEAPDGEELYRQGRKALFRGEASKAIELLEAAVKTDSEGVHAGYRMALSRAYRYAGRLGEAEPLLEAVLKRTPEYVEAGQLLAEILVEQKRWKKLAEVLEPLLEYRHDYQTYHLLGEASYRLDRYRKAFEYYREAVRLNPESGLDHYQLGNIHLIRNRFSLAAAAFEKAGSLGLQSPLLAFKLGSAYFNLRNYFGRVQEVSVRSGKAGLIHGDWYLIESVPGRQDVFRAAPARSAVYQVSKAIEGSAAASHEMRLLLANIYLNAGRFQRAHELYTAIGSSVPKEDEALYNFYLAESAFGLGRYDQYMQCLAKAAKLDEEAYRSTLIDGYLRVAEKFNQLGDQEAYLKYLTEALAERPETASLHLKLGDAHAAGGALEKAVRHWRMVLDLEPDHPQRTRLLNAIKTASSSGS